MTSVRARCGWRLLSVLAAAVSAVALTPATALAHGLGGRADLPVPVGYFAAGAGVVVVSFLMVSALWTSPRLQGPVIDADTPPRPSRFGSILRVVGVALFTLVIIAGLADGTGSTLNVTPVLVLIGFWLVVPFLSPLIGDWWRWMSPWGWLSRRLNTSVPERPDLVDRFGVAPATLSLLGFTWLELASPNSSDPRTLAIAALVLTGVIVAAGRVAGPESGLRLVDGFHTWFGLLGAVAPRDRTTVGDRPTGWVRTLAAMPSWRGLSWLLVVMIGTVTYDGISGTDWWIGLVGSLRNEMWFETLALAGWVAAIGVAYFCRLLVLGAGGRLGPYRRRRGRSVRPHPGAHRPRLRPRPLPHPGPLRGADPHCGRQRPVRGWGGTCSAPPTAGSASG